MHTNIAANNPQLKSFIEVTQDCHFPIQNLPFGVFKPNQQSTPRAGIAIGDYVLDLSILERQGYFNSILPHDNFFNQATLNAFIALDKKITRQVRNRISELLRDDNPELRDNHELRQKAFYLQNNVIMCLPIDVHGYTDFYSSREHATNLGKMFRGDDNPLLPNWLHLPVGYDGRSSTVVVSGTPCVRPHGQMLDKDNVTPVFGPSTKFDVELEMAFIIGKPNQHGEPIHIKDAPQHIFGMVLLCDWSARDIQKWEYVPLGPFLGKNFMTTISPWIVTLDALEPFRVAGPTQNEPQPLAYLQRQADWNFDIHLELGLKTPKLKTADMISQTNFKNMYWDCCQQLAHHSVNGCKMETGDLLASGTISGSEANSYGSLIELTWAGKNPLQLSSGETRVFLQDHDEVLMTGWCQANNYRVGFGVLSGEVKPAVNYALPATEHIAS